jgi:hypothetical protein
MARPPISLSKITFVDQGANVLFFIAELTQHLPPKGVHYIRRYGLYSSRTRST